MPGAKDNVAYLIAGTIAVFVIGTLVVVFILALNGVALPDTWTSLFGLVVALASGLGGWMLGKNSAGYDSDE